MPYPGPLEDLPDFVDESLDLPNPADYEVAPYQQQAFGRRGLMESLGGLESLNLPAPRSFGMGFAQGLAGSLGTAGTRVQERRAKFESRQAQRAALTDAARIQASRDYRKDRGTALRLRESERLRGDREKAKYEQENPLVDEALLAKYPEIPKRMMGARISQDFINKFALEEPGREIDRERQNKILAMTVDTNKRAANTADLNAYDKLQANYVKEPAVLSYTGVRSNLITAESAAKQNSGPGDIALIYSWHRALEPDKPNVVREGDVALTREAVSALQKAYNVPARFFSGNQLTPAGRQHFLRQMRAALKAREPDYKAVNDQYTKTATGLGQDATRFIRDVTPSAQIKAKGSQFVEP